MGSPYEDLDDWEAYFYEVDWTSEYTPTMWADIDSGTIQEDKFWLQPHSTSTTTHASSSQREATLFVPVSHVFPDLSAVERTTPSCSSLHNITKRRPRFEGDLYAPQWVRGEGVERAGWCGFCSSWHKLKVSTFVSFFISLQQRATNMRHPELSHAIHTWNKLPSKLPRALPRTH